MPCDDLALRYKAPLTSRGCRRPLQLGIPMAKGELVSDGPMMRAAMAALTIVVSVPQRASKLALLFCGVGTGCIRSLH